MKIYTFKCEDCGSKKYKKLDDATYMCSYCGRVEEVYYKKEQQEQERLAKEQAEQQAREQAEQEQVQKEQPQPVYDDHAKIKNISGYDMLMLIFTLVLGCFGVHRFMRGKIITGLIYLFTYGLFGVGWLIDVIREIFRFAEKYRGNK